MAIYGPGIRTRFSGGSHAGIPQAETGANLITVSIVEERSAVEERQATLPCRRSRQAPWLPPGTPHACRNGCQALLGSAAFGALCSRTRRPDGQSSGPAGAGRPQGDLRERVAGGGRRKLGGSHVHGPDPVLYGDRLSALKKCGPRGGKVLVPSRAFIEKLVSARHAADVLDLPTVII